MTIARHAVDLAHARTLAEEFSADIPFELASSRKDPQKLGQLYTTAQTWAATTAVANAGSAVVRQATDLAADANAALFALAARVPGEMLTVALGDEECQLPTTGPTSMTHAARWLDGIRAAVLTTDRRALNTLSKIPTQVVRSSSTRGAEFVYLQVEAWRALVTGGPNIAKLLLAALDAADPDKVEIASANFVLDQVVPELEVMGRLLQRDTVAFNAALEKALNLHKKYWGEGARADQSAGFIAWGLAALTRLALDLGLTVTIESDYMPQVLLRA